MAVDSSIEVNCGRCPTALALALLGSLRYLFLRRETAHITMLVLNCHLISPFLSENPDGFVLHPSATLQTTLETVIGSFHSCSSRLKLQNIRRHGRAGSLTDPDCAFNPEAATTTARNEMGQCLRSAFVLRKGCLSVRNVPWLQLFLTY